MKFFTIRPASCIKGIITLPGDKSIASRSVILSAISRPKTIIKNFPLNQDCLFTVKALRVLGIKIIQKNATMTVFGTGLYGLNKSKTPIFVGNSGTTLRLILGVLAGQNFKAKLTAGKSLSQRPMLRVNAPLRKMGAKITAKAITRNAKPDECPPLIIKGGQLHSVSYRIPVASAQVKSAVLLAGLYAQGLTKVIEPIKTRDHTELMLKLFNADIKVKGNTIVITGGRNLLSPGILTIPGDVSSASFFIAAAAIISDSKILIKNVGLNPSRIGIIRVLRRMGADIEIKQTRGVTNYEPVGDLAVRSSRLKATTVRKAEIPSLIDELPILMVVACYARGKSMFEGAGELRVKETDRIRSMTGNLKAMGADISVQRVDNNEKIIIQGVKELAGTRVRSFGDHRTAMSMIIAALNAKGKTIIDDVACIDKSFPDFLSILGKRMRPCVELELGNKN